MLSVVVILRTKLFCEFEIIWLFYFMLVKSNKVLIQISVFRLDKLANHRGELMHKSRKS